MEQELKKQQETRAVLEDLARDTEIGESVLIPLMQNNDFDVNKCVDVLLDIINDPIPSAQIASDAAALEEEQRMLEEFKKQAELKGKAAAARREQEAKIAQELQRKEKVEQQLEARESELESLGRKLEREWRERMAAQHAELEQRKAALEEQKNRDLQAQLGALGQKMSHEFQAKVEEALKRRLAQEKAAEEKRMAEANARKPEQASSSGKEEDEVVVELNCPKSAEPYSRITVYWEYLSGRPSRSDWIGYYKKSRPADSNSYYVYQKTGGAQKGSLEFSVPNKLGICELRFFQNNNYTIMARSNAIRVGAEVSLKAQLTESNKIEVAINYAKPEQRSSWDWLGLFEVGQRDNSKYYKGMSAYVTKDVIPFEAPKKPGRYEVRYFQKGSGYSELAVSNPVDIDDNNIMKVSPTVAKHTDTVTVVWDLPSIEGSPQATDRVALFRAGEINPLMPLAMQDTHCTSAQGSLKFVVSSKLTPGEYEFVFYQAKSGVPTKHSNRLTVVE